MAAPLTPKPSHKIPALDCLRGVAILAVLGYHILGASYYRFDIPFAGWRPDWHAVSHTFWIFSPLTLGWMGVQLFFVISGFVIHLSYLGRPESHSASRFYQRRFWRIVPPYWVTLIAFVLIGALATPFTLEDIGLHAALLHDFSPKYFFSISPSYWSLAVEVQIYLLYPLLVPVRRRGWLLVLLAVISVATQYVAAWISDPSLQAIAYNSVPVNLAHWWLGVVLAEN